MDLERTIRDKSGGSWCLLGRQPLTYFRPHRLSYTKLREYILGRGWKGISFLYRLFVESMKARMGRPGRSSSRETFQLFANKVAIRPDSSIGFSDGFRIDTGANEQRHLSIYGTVTAVPTRLRYSGYRNRQLKAMKSEYALNTSRNARSRSMAYDVDMELEVGDRVLFSYTAHLDALEVDGAMLVDYDQVIAKNNNGSWRSVNGFVLVEMVQQSLIDFSSGFRVVREDRNKYGYGIVRVLGSPVRHYADYNRTDDIDIKVGDIVTFDRHAPRIEMDEHNTLTDSDSSLFLIQRKDILWT